MLSHRAEASQAQPCLDLLDGLFVGIQAVYVLPKFQLLQPNKALGLGFWRPQAMCQKQEWSLAGGNQSCKGVKVLDCAVEAKARQCGLHLREARATDAVGFGSRRETTSQSGPERVLSWRNLDNQRSLGTDAFAASDREVY
jgi:hypothetical protein